MGLFFVLFSFVVVVVVFVVCFALFAVIVVVETHTHTDTVGLKANAEWMGKGVAVVFIICCSVLVATARELGIN